MKLIKDTSSEGILVIQKNKAYAFFEEDTRPRDYDWDMTEATVREIRWLKKCLKANKWLKP